MLFEANSVDPITYSPPPGVVKPMDAISEALFFVLFIHLNSYKSGSNVVLLFVYQPLFIRLSMIYILYQKYLKKRQCHYDNVALSEDTKANKQKARTSHPVSSLAPFISGLHTFGRKQRFLGFLTMYDSI